MRRLSLFFLPILFIAVFVTACGDGESSDGESYNPLIDPADFVAVVDNPYFPLTPGTTYVFEGAGDEGREHIEVEVTSDTREVMGVTCTVVRDRVWIDGELAEDTYDWYAQDKSGNVWYFGEDSSTIENGEVVDTEGSWEAGVDGAKPGYIMRADPQPGETYRQEYYEGEAEDMAKVVSVDETVEIAMGSYDNCLQNEEWSPLEPDIGEYKYYAPGIGVILEEVFKGGDGRIELIEIRT